MDISKSMTGDLQGEIKLTLERDDYMPQVNKELKDLRKKVQMKGFRKGNTPMGVIRKMHGRSVMVDTVNKLVQQKVFEFIDAEKLDIVGYPLPSEKQEQLDFNPNMARDMEFIFDFGLVPDIEIRGADEETEYEQFDVEVPDEVLDEELEMARKRNGEEVHPEADIQEDDSVVIKALELEDGKVKENGWETGFKVLLSTLDEQYREILLGKDPGFTFDFDIYQLEKDRDASYVKKYLLNLDEDEEKEIGNMFRGEVEQISRIAPAELDQEFFDKTFGPGNVTSRDEARDFFRDQIKGFYDKQSNELLFNELYKGLLEKNEVEMPLDFLRRWVEFSREQEISDSEFEEFVKSYKWTVIRNKLNKMLDIKVDREDVKAGFKQKISSYMQGYAMDDSFYDGMVERMMDNKEEVEKQAEEVAIDKLFRALKERVSIKAIPIGLEAFKAHIEQENARLAEAQQEEE